MSAVGLDVISKYFARILRTSMLEKVVHYSEIITFCSLLIELRVFRSKVRGLKKEEKRKSEENYILKIFITCTSSILESIIRVITPRIMRLTDVARV